MRTRETGNRLSYLSYRHSVGIAMHERQEQDAVTCLAVTVSAYQCKKDRKKT